MVHTHDKSITDFVYYLFMVVGHMYTSYCTCVYVCVCVKLYQ